MAINLTNATIQAALESSKEPNIILEIEGHSTLYGAVPILEEIRIGEDGLEIGDPDTNSDAFYVGGFKVRDDSKDYVALDSTTSSIRQTLNQDRGKTGSIQTFDIALIDKNEEITQLISPDTTQTPTFDVLGRRAKVYLLFQNTTFPSDAVTIFRGLISDIKVGAGLVNFQLISPERKKRKTLFKQIQTNLDGAIDASTTTINLDDASELLFAINGPDGVLDTSFKSYVRIDDELIEFTGTSGNALTGVVRGALGTTAATHEDEADTISFYRLTGNVIDLSLKLMLSGSNDFEDQTVTHFNFINSENALVNPNALFFRDTQINDRFNVQVGDFITTTGASNGANNVTSQPVIAVDQIDGVGGVVYVGGTAAFVEEKNTSGLVTIISQYKTLPDGCGMLTDEVDVIQHLALQRQYVPVTSYDFYLKDSITGYEFLEEQVYSPISAFSIPRQARSSVGMHQGPIPGSKIPIMNENNIKKPSAIKIGRSVNRYYFNEIVYRFDQDALEDRFLGGNIKVSNDSKAQIAQVNKTLQIDSLGLRSSLNGAAVANSSATRRLNRYEFAAETISLSVTFGEGFPIEIGDIVLADLKNVKVSDITVAARNFQTRLMEVNNKTLNTRTGDVTLLLVDTNFDTQGRYGLISPASKIKGGVSTTEFEIKESFASIFGQNEFQKWDGFTLPVVRVRSKDYTKIDTTVITGISGNRITVSPSLSITPDADDVMELAKFNSPLTTTDEIKLSYAFVSDDATFPDGSDQYIML